MGVSGQATSDRFLTYKNTHCWQYDVRLRNCEEDLRQANLTKDEVEKFTPADFHFEYIDKTDKEMCRRVLLFIERHEWLGKMPLHPTHRFVAMLPSGTIAGVIVMAMPNAFTYLLGKENRRMEKLISRGACISWSPKNLASKLLMWSIRWMVKNTHYRFFTAYSDPEAKELGTIYQACNFIYLGKTSGTPKMFFDPQRPERGWFSDRMFRSRSSYKKYAKNLGISWRPEWQSRERILWDEMPADTRERIKDEAKNYQERCEYRKVPVKHKYGYILGVTQTETKFLKTLFAKLNPERVGLPYPKERGL